MNISCSSDFYSLQISFSQARNEQLDVLDLALEVVGMVVPDICSPKMAAALAHLLPRVGKTLFANQIEVRAQSAR